MTSVDFEQIFASMPDPAVVLSRDFIICAVNKAYLSMTETRHEDLIGKPAFDVFPGGGDSDDNGPGSMLASFRRVVDDGVADSMWLQRYDIPKSIADGGSPVRYWNIKNSPVFGEDGKVEYILNRGQDVSDVHTDLERVLEWFRGSLEEDRRDGPDTDLLRRFSEFSANSLEGSAMLRALAAEVAQLHKALESRANIEQAKGMLMAAHQIDENAAFEMLSRESQHTNRKLASICREFVERASSHPS